MSVITRRKRVIRFTGIMVLILSMIMTMCPVLSFAAEGWERTINADSSDIAIRTINGSVIASDNGIRVISKNQAEVTVNGNVTATEGKGVSVTADGGTAAVYVNGKILAGETGIEINEVNGGSAVVTAQELSSVYGTAIVLDENSGTADILVDDTISAAGSAVNLGSAPASSLDLTTWKVIWGSGASAFTGNNKDAFSKSVNYIVRVDSSEGPETGAFSMVYKNGSDLSKSHGYDVAHKGEDIYVKPNSGSVWQIVNVYNYDGTNKTPLNKSSDGRYYYTVQEGGGIDIYARLRYGNAGDWKPVGCDWVGNDDDGYTGADVIYQYKDGRTDKVEANVTMSVVEPTCGTQGYTLYTATVAAEDSIDGKPYTYTKEIKFTDPTGNHKWDAGVVTKPATRTEKGEKIYTCTVCGAKVREELPIDPNAPDGGGSGSSAKGVVATDGDTVNKDLVPSSGNLLAKMKSKGKKKLSISWTGIQSAAGYDIFVGPCKANGDNCRRVKTVYGYNSTKCTIKKIGKSKLKARKSYCAYVLAFVYRDGRKVYIDNSPTIHAYTSKGNKKYTNPKSVKVKETFVQLAPGNMYKIQAKVTKTQKKKKLINHEKKLRYVCNNLAVAEVDPSGIIVAKAKGSCTIYAIAVNGARKAVTVIVQ
jgi:hypothetical protein